MLWVLAGCAPDEVELTWGFAGLPEDRLADACGTTSVAVVDERSLPVASAACAVGSLTFPFRGDAPYTARLLAADGAAILQTAPVAPPRDGGGRRITFEPLVTAEGACDDGIDADVDGLLDCDDPDCDGELVCIPPCEPALVISRVYAAGGAAEGLDSDFVELHDRDLRDAALDGLELLALDDAGVWQRRALGGGVAAGRFATFLFRRGGAGAFFLGEGYGPDVDLDPAGLSVALVVAGTPAPDGGCPESWIDLVGIGPGAGCSEGSAWSDLVPGPTQTVDRVEACVDTGDNDADLVVAPLPDPVTDGVRTAAAEALVCACP